MKITSYSYLLILCHFRLILQDITKRVFLQWNLIISLSWLKYFYDPHLWYNSLRSLQSLWWTGSWMFIRFNSHQSLGYSGKQTLKWRSMCKRFIKNCSRDQHQLGKRQKWDWAEKSWAVIQSERRTQLNLQEPLKLKRASKLPKCHLKLCRWVSTPYVFKLKVVGQDSCCCH